MFNAKLLPLGILAIVVGCAQPLPTAQTPDQPMQAPDVATPPETISLDQTVQVPDEQVKDTKDAEQVKDANNYQIQQRGRGGRGGRIGGRGGRWGGGRWGGGRWGGSRWGGRWGGSRWGGRWGGSWASRSWGPRIWGRRNWNRFYSYGGYYYPIYDYQGGYYPDYYTPYTFTSGAYIPVPVEEEEEVIGWTMTTGVC